VDPTIATPRLLHPDDSLDVLLARHAIIDAVLFPEGDTWKFEKYSNKKYQKKKIQKKKKTRNIPFYTFN
jgi:hypothetical protein